MKTTNLIGDKEFFARIHDKEKTPLAKTFIDEIYTIAKDNFWPVDNVWIAWREYCKQCTNFDQSPLISEFKEWNKLN